MITFKVTELQALGEVIPGRKPSLIYEISRVIPSLYLSPHASVSFGCPGCDPHGMVSVIFAATETAMKKPVT